MSAHVETLMKGTNTSKSRTLYAGYAAMVGGALGIVLAPIMVIVKYMTGWAIIPEPKWISSVQSAMGALLEFTTPVGAT